MEENSASVFLWGFFGCRDRLPLEEEAVNGSWLMRCSELRSREIIRLRSEWRYVLLSYWAEWNAVEISNNATKWLHLIHRKRYPFPSRWRLNGILRLRSEWQENGAQNDGTFYCHIERNEMQSKYLAVYHFKKGDSSTALRMTRKNAWNDKKKSGF